MLSARAAGTRQTLCDTPGKSLYVRIDPAANKGGLLPSSVANLHKRLKSDFAIAPTDESNYNYGSYSVKKRRALRSIEQCKSFIQASLDKEKCHPESLFVSIQGGIVEPEKGKSLGALRKVADFNNNGNETHTQNGEDNLNLTRFNHQFQQLNHREECAKATP